MVPYICNIPICKCIYIITCFLLGPAWNIIVQHFATIAWDHVALKQVHSLYETGLPWLVIFLLAHHGHYPKTPKTTQKQTPGGWGCFWVFFLWRRFFTKHDPNSNSWPETGTGKFPLGLVHQKSTPQVPKIQCFPYTFWNKHGTCGGLFWWTNPNGKLTAETPHAWSETPTTQARWSSATLRPKASG